MSILKRKRSESEFSFSSCSTFSSPPRPCSSNFNFGGMDGGMDTPIRYGAAPSHLPSRTLKRFRDNRLSEEQIHQNTLKMLYSAQQQHHNTSQHPQSQPRQPTPVSTSSSSSSLAQPSPSTSGQRSLHAFWNLPAQPPSSTASYPNLLPPPIEKAALALAAADNNPSSCEDCGTSIPPPEDEGGVGMSMDVDMDGNPGLSVAGGASRCVACAKVVCGSCSVSNLGAEPRCLVCAGR